MEGALKFKTVSVYVGETSAMGIYKYRALELIEMVLRRVTDVVLYGPGAYGLESEVRELVPIFEGVQAGDILLCSAASDTVQENRAKAADAFIILPGCKISEKLPGITTLAKSSNKRMYLLNIDGFFDSVLASKDRSVQNGIIVRNTIAAASVNELIKEMEVSH